MRSVLFTFAAILSFTLLHAQVAPDMYFIHFTDKNNNIYTLLQPDQFLGLRALQRRAITQTPLDNYDLPVTPMYVDSMQAMGFSVRCVTKWLNGVVVYTANASLLSQLSGISFVEGYRKCGDVRASKKLEIELKDLPKGTKSTDYGAGATQIELVNGDYLHDLNFKGQGMLISVVDAGFDGADTIVAFDVLHSSGRVIYTYDVINRQSFVYGYHSHGTMVLSVMASNVPGELVGTAPEATYALIRTEDGSTENIIEEYYMARGFEIADSLGSDCINTSLGYSLFDDSLQNHTWAELDGRTAPSSIAAGIGASRGIIIVVAAGNSGDDSWMKLTVPADADSILSAGSVNYAGVYSSFSSTGPSADGRVKPDVVAMGQDASVYSTSGNVFQGSGTSFASPILCGLSTCLWQALPQLKPQEILNYIRVSADQYNNPDEFRGYGLPDFAQALLLAVNSQVPDKYGEFFYDIYPNPFKDAIYLRLYTTDSQTIKINVYDALGRSVTNAEAAVYGWMINRIMVNIDPAVSAGVYYVQLTTEKKRYTGIVTKQ